MSKYIEKLAASGELSPEQIERIGHNTASFMRAYREDADLQKSAAGFMDMMKSNLPRAAAAGAIGVLGGAASQVGSMAVQSVRDSIGRARGYKAMIDANPQLMDGGHDARAIQRAYDMLHKFNPQYASDPTVAGTFVQRTLANGTDIGALNNIVQARKNLADSNKGQDLMRFYKMPDPMREARESRGNGGEGASTPQHPAYDGL